MGSEETDVGVVRLEEQIGERRGGVGYEVGEDGVWCPLAMLQSMASYLSYWPPTIE
jgi:hypothetical protein